MADEVDLVGIHHGGGYGSEFEFDSDAEKKEAKRQDLAQKEKPKKSKLPQKRDVTEEYNKEEGRTHRFHVLSLDAYARHKKFINDYLLFYGGSKKEFTRDASRDKTDYDVIRENHRFLWTEEDEADESWEKTLAKKYYDKLFKEYCITDLSRYKENKIAMRWRIEKEVVEGKGQFICGNKKCSNEEGLRSWEVNFGYMEHGEKKNALVKLRLCPECSYKPNYHRQRKEIKAKRKSEQHAEKSSKKHKQSHGEEREKSTHSLGGADSRKTDSEQLDRPSTSSASASKKEGEGDKETGVWAQPLQITEEKSRDEEFDDYFEDMFL